MRPKQKIRLITDLCMTVLLPVLMAYSLVGEALHEWVGTAMLLCLILHHVLNVHKPTMKTPVARINTILNFTLFVLLLLLMVSGIVMSRTVFQFLPLDGGWAMARKLHLPLAYWSYVLMSVHMGLHANTIFASMRKRTGRKPSAAKTIALRCLAATAAAYGLYGFMARDFPDYLFLKNHFVFLDFEEPLVFFFVDYFAIMALFAVMGYLIMKLARRRKKRLKEESP